MYGYLKKKKKVQRFGIIFLKLDVLVEVRVLGQVGMISVCYVFFMVNFRVCFEDDYSFLCFGDLLEVEERRNWWKKRLVDVRL